MNIYLKNLPDRHITFEKTWWNGLNLQYARELESYSGRIWIDKDYRDGAAIKFTIPINQDTDNMDTEKLN